MLRPTAQDLLGVEREMIGGAFLSAPHTISGRNIPADRDRAVHPIFIGPYRVSICTSPFHHRRTPPSRDIALRRMIKDLSEVFLGSQGTGRQNRHTWHEHPTATGMMRRILGIAPARR